MKPVVLTAHAKHVANERGIPELVIKAAVQAPDWMEPDPSGAERRFKAIEAFGDRILRIVCTETDTELRVITVFFDRNARSPR
jgi:hypothetical protein